MASPLFNWQNTYGAMKITAIFFLLFSKKKPLLFLKEDKQRSKLLSLDTQDIQKHLHFTYAPHLKFSSYPLLLLSCQSYLKSYALLEAMEQDFFLNMYQKDFEAPSPTYLKYINPKIGLGIFASKKLYKGQYIGEYTGQVRPSNILPTHNPYLFSYSPPGVPRLCVDAKEIGGEMRFLNHSYEPNLKGVKVFYEGICHIYFLTARPIDKDEQLLIDYGPLYWSNSTPLE